MRVEISKSHISLNKKLVSESNSLARNFNARAYSKLRDAGAVVLKRDVSIEKKKQMLLQELHKSIISAFSINKKKFSKKLLSPLKKRLQSIRIIINKLRSINYYLETAFLEDLKHSKIKIAQDNQKIKAQNNFGGDELELLEYMTYRLIGEAAVLDRRLLKGYAGKNKKIIEKERTELKGLGALFKKESLVLEHLEAKLPPPKKANLSLLKEPVFTHWVARVFALLSYLEHLHQQEKEIFGQLKKDKPVKIKINKKIRQIMQEKAKLVSIMETKANLMKKFKMDSKFKKELHNLTTAIAL